LACRRHAWPRLVSARPPEVKGTRSQGGRNFHNVVRVIPSTTQGTETCTNDLTSTGAGLRPCGDRGGNLAGVRRRADHADPRSLAVPRDQDARPGRARHDRQGRPCRRRPGAPDRPLADGRTEPGRPETGAAGQSELTGPGSTSRGARLCGVSPVSRGKRTGLQQHDNFGSRPPPCGCRGFPPLVTWRTEGGWIPHGDL
jgi:hypothetical protein